MLRLKVHMARLEIALQIIWLTNRMQPRSSPRFVPCLTDVTLLFAENYALSNRCHAVLCRNMPCATDVMPLFAPFPTDVTLSLALTWHVQPMPHLFLALTARTVADLLFRSSYKPGAPAPLQL